MRGNFDYDEAFSRNIGWVTGWEQQQLRGKRVAIAGMGGVGGNHLLTLVRLGIGAFSIADLDVFELANFNRQAGAVQSTLGYPKAEVMAKQALDINPELDIRLFSEGVSDGSVDAFLDGVDLFVDGFDFFAIGIRRRVFARCYELGIPAITAAPIGMGTGYLIFMPGGMTFEQYFRMEGLPDEHQFANFFVGLVPKAYHRRYLVDRSRLDLVGRRGPSTAAAIQLCAGVVGTEALKILLGRGKVFSAPWYRHFDAYRGKFALGKLRWGNAGPVQSLKRRLVYKSLDRLARDAWPIDETQELTELEQILDLSRWAPSGDNTQPWRFEIGGDEDAVIHVQPKEDDVYDYNDNQPTLISTGLLLETMRIAATGWGRALTWSYLGRDGTAHRIAVRLPRAGDVEPDPLIAYIGLRSVDRRPYLDRRLSPHEKAALAAALGTDLDILWHESRAERWRETRLNMMSTDIRLRSPAAYRVHKRIIDWDRRFSRTGIPVEAVGLDRLMQRSMRWAMETWRRADVMNRFLGGTLVPRLELDLLPGMSCAAHFSLYLPRLPRQEDERLPSLLRSGQAIQRFWLTATSLGLAMQPALAPVIFAHYARHGGLAETDGGLDRRIRALDRRLSAAQDSDVELLVFRGRIGVPRSREAISRSVRHRLQDLKTGSG